MYGRPDPVGKRKSLMTPLSTISTTMPASSELRDKRSGCYARMASYLPFSISFSICENSGRLPDFFADLDP